MRTSSVLRLFRNTAFVLLALPAATPSWAADGAIDPANETFTKALRLDPDAPKSLRWDAYLSGYAYHDRDTYSKAQLRKMNETTWGGGLGRTYRNEKGDEESAYLMGIRDSNNRPQWMAGYSYQWMFGLKSKNNTQVGLGLTGLLVRRHDWYNGRPFPAILPVASIGNRTAQLVATYVPHLSDRKKKGNILQVMLKLSM